MKATFFERLGSYLIDTIIVFFIFSLICLGFGNYTSNAEKRMQELDEQLKEETITPGEYLEEYLDAFYDYQKENVLQSGISVALTIAYFVVFQYMNKGQTIGKKLLNIRVVDKDTNKPISILKGLLRTSTIYTILSGTILSGTLCIIFLYLLAKETYLITCSTLIVMEVIFTLTTIFFVLYRTDHRGLHDMIANTTVIKESR